MERAVGTRLTSAKPGFIDFLPLDVESNRETLLEALSDVRIGKGMRQVRKVEKGLMLEGNGEAGERNQSALHLRAQRELPPNCERV
jgi:hypothetical protein